MLYLICLTEAKKINLSLNEGTIGEAEGSWRYRKGDVSPKRDVIPGLLMRALDNSYLDKWMQKS